MKHITRIRSLLAGTAMLGLLAGASAPAEAAFIFDMVETGGNVAVTGSGSFNLAGLRLSSAGGGAQGVEPISGYLVVSAGIGSIYSGMTGPSSFGLGGLSGASSGSGDLVGFAGNANLLLVPTNYVSGTALSSGMTFLGATLASLGATPGTYVWNWGSGPNADSLTLNISQRVSVPEPASLALFGAGLLGLAGLRRRKAA